MKGNLTTTEPVGIAGAVVAFVQAVLTALVLLDVVDLSSEQTAGLMAVVTAGVTLVVSVWARNRVTPRRTRPRTHPDRSRSLTMATLMQAESTEFVFIGVNGSVPSVGAEVAFLTQGARPQAGDWETAAVVTSEADPLWSDAVASGVKGDYYVAILVGPFGDTGVTVEPDDYQVWLRLTDTIEQPVRIAPTALEAAG